MTRRTLYRATVAAAVAALPLLGCDRTRPQARFEQRSALAQPAPRTAWGMVIEAPPYVGGGPVTTDVARKQISSARCDREAACGFIASDAKWATRQACDEVVSAEYSDDLTDDDCPNGVDGSQLNQCLSDARTTDCSMSVDVIGRVPSCRNSKLCVK